MRILMWHGYLLTGSGSNVLTANVAGAWRRAGHDVLLLCQERSAGAGFVDEAGDFAPDNRSFDVTPTGAPAAAGRVRLVRPDLGGLLPVYVYDDYPGFRVKRFVDLTDTELDDYTDANVTALATALAEHRPEAVVVGHEVMGPYVALRACGSAGTPYAVQLHGSALEFAVKVQERFRAYARQGLRGAAVVFGGSRYMVRAAAAVAPGWEDRAIVVNPGCDTNLFLPVERAETTTFTAGFVGKLIASKGVHNFVVAVGASSTRPLRAVVVGFGALERQLRALAAALERGDRAGAIATAASAPGMETAAAFLATAAPRYFARAQEVDIEFTGRLEHEALATVLPTWDALVVPSVVPEAFGMVAAEAAASGVLPIVPDHSGIGEVGAALEDAIGSPGMLTFDPERPVEQIAAAVDRLAAAGSERRRAYGRAAAALARRRWSWAHVAEEILRHVTARTG